MSEQLKQITGINFRRVVWARRAHTTVSFVFP